MAEDWAYERVVRFLADHTGRTPDTIRLDESLSALEMDSLEDVEFIMEIEDELGIEIANPPQALRTVDDLVTFLRSVQDKGNNKT